MKKAGSGLMSAKFRTVNDCIYHLISKFLRGSVDFTCANVTILSICNCK